jgi:ribose 5-phosphate isomerase B
MIYLGADHGGFALKEELKKLLKELSLDFTDEGNATFDQNDDYVDFASCVARAVSKDNGAQGILLCRSGIGMDIVANKFPGVRCALVATVEAARLSRLHNDANVLALSADFLDPDKALSIARVWLVTPFSGEERHAIRLAKIKAIESEHAAAISKSVKKIRESH